MTEIEQCESEIKYLTKEYLETRNLKKLEQINTKINTRLDKWSYLNNKPKQLTTQTLYK